jgi:hypothetical protein
MSMYIIGITHGLIIAGLLTLLGTIPPEQARANLREWVQLFWRRK